jgi:hypothetical protein
MTSLQTPNANMTLLLRLLFTQTGPLFCDVLTVIFSTRRRRWSVSRSTISYKHPCPERDSNARSLLEQPEI